ncbi:MAG: hypothetical protein LBL07_01850 [Tannerella sp.]|nr:hypothetical protein [Tannerella sp.]
MQKNVDFIKAPFEGGISDGRIKKANTFPDCFALLRASQLLATLRRDGACRRPCDCEARSRKQSRQLKMSEQRRTSLEVGTTV